MLFSSKNYSCTIATAHKSSTKQGSFNVIEKQTFKL